MKRWKLSDIYKKLNDQYSSLEHDFASPRDLQEMVLSFGIPCNDLELDWHTEQESTIRLIPFMDWICTDAPAGIQAIGNSEGIIGFRNRAGRKYDWEYEWISKDCLRELQSELNRFQIQPKPAPDIVDLDWVIDFSKYALRNASKKNLDIAKIETE